jgi:hypothetical protein
MGKSLWIIPVVLLFATLVAPTAVRADTVYTVNQTIGPGSVTGAITTNGTIGTLSAADIVGWNLTLNDGTNIADLILSNSAVVVGGDDLSATASNLSFNFSGTGFNYDFYFYGTSAGAVGELCYTAWSNCWGPTGVGLYDVGGDNLSVYIGETGNLVIATATPEPGTGGLMMLGIGLALGMRKRIAQGLPLAT